MNGEIGKRDGMPISTIGVLKDYFFSLKNMRFNSGFKRCVLPEVPNFVSPFSGQISTLTLGEDTRGVKIRAEGGKISTFTLDQFIAILYFLAQKCQNEGGDGPLLNNYKPNVFRVRIGDEEKGQIVPILVRWNRRLLEWNVSYTQNMDFDGWLWSAESKVFFPE